MANQGAKKRLEENRKRLNNLRIAIAIGLGFYFLVRLVLLQGWRSKWQIVGLGATGILEAVSYSAISKFAEPEFSASGEVLYGGSDLSMGGVCAYWHDLLYITLFVQVASCVTSYAWYTYLAVPGFAAYMLTTHVLLPMWAASRAPDPAPLDAATRKKLERTQQRAERRKMKWR